LIVILMGVVGAGKTTVGRLLAEKLHWDFADADDFHSASNVEKIRHGIPLGDQDRGPWLLALHNAIAEWNRRRKNMVLACSALKEQYRNELRVGRVQFVYLKGSREVILNRLRSRHGHFASESILDSQFADLEEPKDAVVARVDNSPEAIADEIIAKLNLPH
jgi:gluconokinase